jgi:hypothetical protein
MKVLKEAVSGDNERKIPAANAGIPGKYPPNHLLHFTASFK